MLEDETLGAADELDELGDAAAVLARNFLFMFIDVKRFAGVGATIFGAALGTASSVTVDGAGCSSAAFAVASGGGTGVTTRSATAMATI